MSRLALEALRERVRRAGLSTVDFFALVRSLEELLRTSVGGETDAARERVHFTHPPSLSALPGDIADFLVAEHAGKADVTLATSFLGLLGVESPLGPAWTEDVLFEEEPNGLQAFYDVFQHRALTLLYRAWARFAPFAVSSEDGLARGLLSLIGVDAFAPEIDERAVAPEQSLGLSDMVRCDPTYLDLAALESLLTRFYRDLQPRVSSTAARWVPKAPEDATLLGSQRSALGTTFTYGTGALDVGSSLRLTVGPVNRPTFERLMPGGDLYRTLRATLSEWLAERAAIELEVLLASKDAPRLRLGDSDGGRLGVDMRYASEDAIVRVRVHLLVDETRATRSYHAG